MNIFFFNVICLNFFLNLSFYSHPFKRGIVRFVLAIPTELLRPNDLITRLREYLRGLKFTILKHRPSLQRMSLAQHSTIFSEQCYSKAYWQHWKRHALPGRPMLLYIKYPSFLEFGHLTTAVGRDCLAETHNITFEWGGYMYKIR